MSLHEMKTAALQLPFAERSELAKALLLSMEQPSEIELEALWEAEINSRIEAVQKGETKLIPGEEAFARARAALRR
jgi:putative addiction module component (TIGR02574 family)